MPNSNTVVLATVTNYANTASNETMSGSASGQQLVPSPDAILTVNDFIA